MDIIRLTFAYANFKNVLFGEFLPLGSAPLGAFGLQDCGDNGRGQRKTHVGSSFPQITVSQSLLAGSIHLALIQLQKVCGDRFGGH